MDIKELPGMLVATGIATEQQAADLLAVIQRQEAIEWPQPAGATPAEPRGDWRA